MNKATATRTATTAQMIAAITPPLKEPFPVTVPFPKYRRKEFWLSFTGEEVVQIGEASEGPRGPFLLADLNQMDSEIQI